MYVATDTSTNKELRRSMYYGHVLQWLMSVGYLDPSSYVINYKNELA